MKYSKRNWHAHFIFKVTIFFLATAAACSTNKPESSSSFSKAKPLQSAQKILPGIHQTDLYFPMLKNKRIAVVGNHTSRNDTVHLVDLLIKNGFKVVKVFAPEHGFRGTADAGEKVNDTVDPQTGLPVISLYGRHKKPLPADLRDVDLLLFDIQDVGVRFYTYLSTLHYVMEAGAENHVPVMVLDRPNPHIAEVDGPVMEKKYFSFVGMHPVPILYGMTIGEYARMINGEGWLKNGIRADLTVIPIRNYTRDSSYVLPVKPSPNLPNAQAVALYPSLCLFEPTDISVGRGTDWPFQIYGSPLLPPEKYAFSFTPHPNAGARHPKHNGKKCFGEDLRSITPPKGIYLDWLLKAYRYYPEKEKFFRNGFERIAGTDTLRRQIEKGLSANEIKKSWQKKLEEFKKIRKKYLLY